MKPIKAPKHTAKTAKAWADVLPHLTALSSALLPVYDAASTTPAERALIREHNPTFAALLSLAGRND